jgi:hypothetical protein
MIRWLSLPLVALALAATSLTAAAGEKVEPEDLIKVIQQQNEKIDSLLSRVKGLEDSQRAVREAISEGFQRTESLASKLDNAAEGGVPPWVTRVRFTGDFRYRHEFFDIEANEKDRHRQRIRVRIGLQAQPCDDLDFYFRLASGDSDDARSTNVTLEDNFSSKDVWLDLAYFDWHPRLLFGVHILGGKMKNPFFRPGGEEMIFDSDVNPEGLALTYAIQPIEMTKVFASGGGFWMNENPSGRDTILYGVQTGVTQGIGDYVKVTAGGSYYDFGKTEGESVYTDDGDGNTVVDGNPPADPDEDGVFERGIRYTDMYYDTPSGDRERVYVVGGPELTYMYDYQIFEVFTQVDIQAGPIPIAVIGDYVKNDAAGASEDKGWLVGIKVGKTKKRAGTWEVGYNYRDVEADAVLGALSASDTGQGSDIEVHKVFAGVMLTRCMKVRVTYYKSEIGQSRPPDVEDWENDYERVQVDLILTF